jgi:hypothetical protein
VKEYGPGRFAVKVVTPVGAERIARFACRLAKARKARGKPGKVTCVTKSNVMPRSDGLFRETAERVVREVGGLEFEHFYVDDASRRLVRFPKSMDVVLSMNLYADILSDLGAETAGGLGLAPSGCFGDGWAYFESVHGSAPDIAGPRHRESDGDHSLRGDDARAHGPRGRGRAARGGGGARLPRRQGADARPGRHGKDARDGAGSARRVPQRVASLASRRVSPRRADKAAGGAGGPPRGTR